METADAAAAVTVADKMPKQEAAAAAAEDSQETRPDVGDAGRSHSKSSSTSSTPAPSCQQIARNMRGLREDVESHADAISELRKQMLWSMSQQVRSEQLLTSRQLVFQGFAPAMEDRSLDQAMAKRDQWILQTLRDHTQLSEKAPTLRGQPCHSS